MRGAAGILCIVWLGACTQTTLDTYADRDQAPRYLTHIVAYVAAPATISNEAQATLNLEGAKHGVTFDNAFYLFPTGRSYTEQDVKRVMSSRGVDGVLLIRVGNSAVVKEYAGTLFGGIESVAIRSANNFGARLIEPSSGQILWSGNGKVTESGLLIFGNQSGPTSVATTILSDLKAKGLLRN